MSLSLHIDHSQLMKYDLPVLLTVPHENLHLSPENSPPVGGPTMYPDQQTPPASVSPLQQLDVNLNIVKQEMPSPVCEGSACGGTPGHSPPIRPFSGCHVDSPSSSGFYGNKRFNRHFFSLIFYKFKSFYH